MKLAAILFSSLCSLLLSGGLSLVRAESHHWDSADGKFSIDGVLLRVEEAACVLQTTDGRELKVGLGQLSLSDLAFIADWQSDPTGATRRSTESPKPPTPAEPAMPQEPVAAAVPAAPSQPASGFRPPRAPAAMATPEPALKETSSAPQLTTLPFGGKGVNVPVGFSPWLLTFDDGLTRFYDLRRPDSLDQEFNIRTASECIAISASGQLIATVLKDRRGVALISRANGFSMRTVIIPDLRGPNELQFAGEDWLLLVDGDDQQQKIIGIDFRQATVAWRISAPETRLIVSPSGKWFAPLAQQGEVVVNDCRTGQEAMRLHATQSHLGGAFTPDDNQMVTVASKDGKFGLVTYDLRRKVSSFTMSTSVPSPLLQGEMANEVQWPDPEGPIFIGARAMIRPVHNLDVQEVSWGGKVITGPVRFQSPQYAFGFDDKQGYIRSQK